MRLCGLACALALAVSAGCAAGAEVRITNADDFIQFKDNVSNGKTYAGTTVFLDSDIDFTGKTFEPIGTSGIKHFNGTFDGQGHVISNIVMTSSLQYVGLFGYSKGLTIKNVILDSSCSFTSSYDSGAVYFGGIIGNCNTNNGPCTIENSVNMGSVAFSGDISGNVLYLGGIAGYLSSSSSSSHVSIMKNCANYGDVTHSGESKDSYIGGVVGQSYGSSASKRVHIYNCINHGTITHKGTSSNSLRLGGIVGYAYRYVTIENCVSGGKISSLTTASGDNYIGSIIGDVSSDTSINYCYFTSDMGYDKYGTGTPSSESNILSYDSTSFNLGETVSIGGYSGNSLISALNGYSDYYKDSDYSNWLLNKGKNAVTFTINGGTNPIKMDYQIILLPSLASEGNMSFLWFSDDRLTTPLTEFEVTGDTSLYGKYCHPNFTVTLDVNGGDELGVKEMAIGCDMIYGDLPEATRTGYSFTGWFTGRTGGDKIESGAKVTIPNAHTLYAHWTINQYTITFEANGGGACEPITQDYNTAVELPKPTKTGYTFAYWCSDASLAKEYTDTTMPAEDKTLYAKWNINRYSITFKSDGVIIKSEELDYGSTITYPSSPSKAGYTFVGWDSDITSVPDYNVTINAKWSSNASKYTLTFIFRNGDEPVVVSLEFNETITYPADPVRVGYSFAGWDSDITSMPANNIAITAQWIANNCTVTFNPNGGIISQSTKVVTFGSAYGDLPTPTRTGYAFLGWFTEEIDGKNTTAEDVVEIPGNHTLFAHWLESRQSQVEIVFSTKDMSKEEIEEIIKEYTDADFKITVIENNEDEGRVIVEFVDAKKAEEFTRKVNAVLERGEVSLIKRVDLVHIGNDSFSPAYHSMSLLFMI